MTHDELLSLVDQSETYKALRAVVELHKPSRYDDGCAHCKMTDITARPYPCPTIQAIEKELK